MSADYEELTEAARRLAAALHIPVAEVVLKDKRGNPRLILPVPAAGAPEANGRKSVPLEILKALREAGHRMTATLIHEALLDRGFRLSERTLADHLAGMVQDGTLDNDQKVKPPGYGVPS